MTPAFLVKIFCFLILLSCSFKSFAQFIYTSNDNNSTTPSLWDDPNTWVISNNQSWLPQTPGQPNSHGNFHGAEIYGYTYAAGNLNLNGPDPVVNVYDTLYIEGNATFGSGARLTVHPVGLLVIVGNLRMEGSFDFDNLGTVVVTGNVLVTNGAIDNQKDFYVYGSTKVTNGGDFNGCEPWDECDPEDYTKTENNLINENTPLHQFVSSGNVVLPIQLIFFKGQAFSNHILLTWATAEEENFDYFTIERSKKGIEFEPVGRIYSAGSDTKVKEEYRFTDQYPLTGISYYRLKATDYDGSEEYFKAIYVDFILKDISIDIFPNPGSGRFLNINTAAQEIKDFNFQLFDLSGVLVYQKKLSFPTNTIEFDRPLEKGIYIAVVQGSSKRESFKWLVQ